MTDIVSRPASAGLVARVQSILLKPSATWDEIAAEPSSIKSIYMGYVVPLAAIGPIAQAIGLTVFGINAIIVSYRVPLLWAVSQAIVAYVLTLVMVYVQALIIEALAPNFGGTKDRLNAFKVSAYSWTAAWVAGIFGILPMLGILGILGFYSLYLMYRGLPKLMKAPEDKAVAYTAVVVIVTIVLAAIVFGISGAVGRMGMMGATGPLGMATTPRAAGVVTVPGMGSMDVGKMQAATEQMAAQASAMQNGTATPVKTADPQALLALMPASFMGAARSDTSTDSGGAGGMNVANAEASYVLNGNSLRLKVTDMGGMSGFGAMAQAVNVNHTRTTDTGYEKVESKDGRVVSETWDNQAKSGKYSILAGSRITVEAEGSGVDMATLKNLVNAVDLGRAQALAVN